MATMAYFTLAMLNMTGFKFLPRLVLTIWECAFVVAIPVTVLFWTLLTGVAFANPAMGLGYKAWTALTHIVPLLTLSLEGFAYARYSTVKSAIWPILC